MLGGRKDAECVLFFQLIMAFLWWKLGDGNECKNTHQGNGTRGSDILLKRNK